MTSDLTYSDHERIVAIDESISYLNKLITRLAHKKTLPQEKTILRICDLSNAAANLISARNGMVRD